MPVVLGQKGPPRLAHISGHHEKKHLHSTAGLTPPRLCLPLSALMPAPWKAGWYTRHQGARILRMTECMCTQQKSPLQDCHPWKRQPLADGLPRSDALASRQPPVERFKKCSMPRQCILGSIAATKSRWMCIAAGPTSSCDQNGFSKAASSPHAPSQQGVCKATFELKVCII